MVETTDPSFPATSCSFYIYKNTLRYLKPNFGAPCTLTNDQPLKTTYGTFRFHRMFPKKDGLPKYAIIEFTPKGSPIGAPTEVICIPDDRVTSIGEDQGELYFYESPLSCWRMKDGNPRSIFTPLINPLDQCRIFLFGINLIGQNQVKKEEWDTIEILRELLNDAIKYYTGESDHGPNLDYFPVEKMINQLLADYTPSLL